MKLSIRAKLILYTFCIALLVGGGISFYSISLGRDRLLRNFEHSSRDIVALIAKSIFNDLYFLNLHSLRARLQTAQVNPDITYTLVADAAGVILTDGTEQELKQDQKLTDGFSLRALRARGWISELQGNTLRVGGPILAPDGERRGYLEVGFGLSSMNEVFKDEIRPSLTVTGASLVAGAVLAAFAASSFTRPIRSIARAARALGSGNLKARLAVDRSDELGTLSRSINAMAEALERRQHEQDAINAIALIASRSLELEQVLQAALEKILEVSGREQGHIRLRNASTGEIALVAHRGISPEHMHALAHERRPGGRTDQVFALGRVIVANELADSKQRLLGDAVRAAAWVPLRSRTTVVGVLTVATAKPLPFQPHDIALLETLGNVLGVAIENARLFSQTNNNLKRTQMLREIDRALTSTLALETVLGIFLGNIARMLPYSAATIRLIDKQSGAMEPVACCNLDETDWKRRELDGVPLLLQSVLGEGAPVFVKHIQADSRTADPAFFARHGLISFLGLPLIAKGETLGALSIYTKYEHSFTDDEVKFLSALAAQAAMAIYNSRLYEQTKNQALALDRANKLQADFTAMIAHELRSPLQNVIGVVTLMADGAFGPLTDEQNRWLGKVLATSHNLVDLVSDFLDLSKIEAGYVDLVREEVDLGQLIRNTLESHLPLAQERGLDLRARADATLSPLDADPRLLSQVLNNLLSNAIKFTPRGGVIEIAARQENEAVRVDVKDTGPGIPAAELAGLFSKYRQASSARQSKDKGTGLGLVICKTIVEAHGGRIWAKSEEGKGTTFSFSLPKAAVVGAAQAEGYRL
ncbi:MAG TPA: ATP-binding protein [Candidatus Acidoferrales bacterium]|nr:ATP-binding protein [Candidatus Acidoferrales bacterium]